MNLIYSFVKLIFRIIIHSFYKEIHVIGQNQVPKDGPIIICGIHRNQFVDALMIVSTMQREVSFIAAAKSMKRYVIGDFARAINCIAVQRPQDLAQKGKGIIKSIINEKLLGDQTNFRSQINVGDSLLIQSKMYQIKEILSDQQLEVKIIDQQYQDIPKIDQSFQIIPKVDQKTLFGSVWTALGENKCVGIFPEGGSHDRTDILPLKAGIGIMALGAIEKNPNCKVKIVPVGLNYYMENQIRSNVTIEYGSPFDVPEKIVEKFKIDKKAAVDEILVIIEQKLKNVSQVVPTYNDLMNIYMAKSLYKDQFDQMSAEQEMELQHNLIQIYEQNIKKDDFQKLMSQVQQYSELINNQIGLKLKELGIQDYQLRQLNFDNRVWQLLSIIENLVKALFSFIFVFPSFILLFPLYLISIYYTEIERKKSLAASNVKIYGRDVIASYKILCMIVIYPVYSILFTFINYLAYYNYIKESSSEAFLVSLLFFFIWPIYVFITLRSGDGLIKNFKQMKAKILFQCDNSKFKILKYIRKSLHYLIREIVDHQQMLTLGDQEQKIDLLQLKKNQEILNILQEIGL